jgi:chromate transporter
VAGREGPAPAVHPRRDAFLAAGAALVLWWLPVAAAALAFGGGHILVEIGLLFSKLAVVTFGGAYAVLAYLTDVAVARAWVSPGEMVDGLGLAETTPGPTILVNQFVGFLAALRAPDPFSPYVAATLGALMTVWVTFAPSFLWIFAGGPYLERIVADRRLAGALAAITAAVVGVIATLAVRFAVSVLFAASGTARLGPISLPAPDWTTLRWDAAGLAVLAALLLLRWHRGVVETVAICAGAGLALTLLR